MSEAKQISDIRAIIPQPYGKYRINFWSEFIVIERKTKARFEEEAGDFESFCDALDSVASRIREEATNERGDPEYWQGWLGPDEKVKS